MSSSAYPIIWAMKHAPAADAIERLILIALADAADPDGCNSYRSLRSHLEILVDVSKSAFTRRLRTMEQRGLIRKDTTPPPPRYLKIPHYLRPTRWEVCIPYSWWSDSQREQIQREREDRGLPPITPKSRPDLGPAPEKKVRADKGKPSPQRGRKKKTDEPSDPPPSAPDEELPSPDETPSPEDEGVSSRHGGGCLQDTGGVSSRHGGGVFKTPNLPYDLPVDPPVSPSPSIPPTSAGTAARLGDARAGAKAPSANGEQKQRKERRATLRQNASPQARQILGEIPAAFREGAPPSIIRTMSLRIDRMLDDGWSRGAIIGAAVDVAEARNIDGDHIAAMRALQAALIGNAPGRHCDHCGRARIADGAYCTAGCDAFTVDPGAVPEEIDPDQLARVMEDLGAST